MMGRMKRPSAERVKSWAESDRRLGRAFDRCDLNLRLSVKQNRLDVDRMMRPMELGPVPHRKWNWLPWCRRRRWQRASILRGLLSNDRTLRAIWDDLEKGLE